METSKTKIMHTDQSKTIPLKGTLTPELELALLRQYFRSMEERLAIMRGDFLKDINYQAKVGALHARLRESEEITNILKKQTTLLDTLNPKTVITLD